MESNGIINGMHFSKYIISYIYNLYFTQPPLHQHHPTNNFSEPSSSTTPTKIKKILLEPVEFSSSTAIVKPTKPAKSSSSTATVVKPTERNGRKNYLGYFHYLFSNLTLQFFQNINLVLLPLSEGWLNLHLII